jgi:uncharacterized lipoprotein YbaY
MFELFHDEIKTMKKIVTSLGLSLTLLTGCTSMSQTSEHKANQATALMVEFVGTGNHAVQPQQGTVSLYAVESRIADVPATLIQQKKVQVSQVPFSVEFNVPAGHRQLIQPQVRDDAEISYYVTWQSDSNNLKAKDTIVIDYDRQFPKVSLGQGKQQVYLK